MTTTTKLPQAPRLPIDRITRATDRWSRLIYSRPPLFAAHVAEVVDGWTVDDRRRLADIEVRRAFGRSLINRIELDTWLAILRTWADQTPGARMAAVVGFTELHGKRYPEPYGVLTQWLAD